MRTAPEEFNLLIITIIILIYATSWAGGAKTFQASSPDEKHLHTVLRQDTPASAARDAGTPGRQCADFRSGEGI